MDCVHLHIRSKLKDHGERFDGRPADEPGSLLRREWDHPPESVLRMRFTVTGVEELRQRLRSNPGPALAKALYVEAQRIMTESKTSYVPVDHGTLRASGHVQAPVIAGGQVSVTLGYGGAASAYAIVQHERLDYQHTIGQAKYLEVPVKNAVRGISGRLGANLDLF